MEENIQKWKQCRITADVLKLLFLENLSLNKWLYLNDIMSFIRIN